MCGPRTRFRSVHGPARYLGGRVAPNIGAMRTMHLRDCAIAQRVRFFSRGRCLRKWDRILTRRTIYRKIPFSRFCNLLHRPCPNGRKYLVRDVFQSPASTPIREDTTASCANGRAIIGFVLKFEQRLPAVGGRIPDFGRSFAAEPRSRQNLLGLAKLKPLIAEACS